MTSEPGMANKPESEMKLEDLKDEKETEDNIEITTTSTQSESKSKQSKACDTDSYIVKLFKNLMNPKGENGQDSEGKKK